MTHQGPGTAAREERSARIAVFAFPAFILLGAALALLLPDPFIPLADHISVMIALIMLCMGFRLQRAGRPHYRH